MTIGFNQLSSLSDGHWLSSGQCCVVIVFVLIKAISQNDDKEDC